MLSFYFHTSPYPMKVALFLEETGLPYKLEPIDTFKGEQHAPNFLSINPNARTPAIVDGGRRVFDSTAILLYLAEKADQFLSPSKDRGEMLAWLMFVATGLAPMSGQLVHFTRVHADTYAENRYRREAERLHGIMNERLNVSRYLAGDTYTIADISAWGWIRITDLVLGEGQLSRFPKLTAWFETIDQRPAAERARAIAAGSAFKTDFDEETLRAMFPQNYPAHETTDA